MVLKFIVTRTSSHETIWDDWYYDGEPIPPLPCPMAKLGHTDDGRSFYYIELTERLWADLDLSKMMELFECDRIVLKVNRILSLVEEFPLEIEIYDDYRE